MSRFGISAYILFCFMGMMTSLCFAQETATTITTTTTPTTVINPTTTVTSPAPQASPTVVERRVIVTTAPAPKETVAIPTGYVNCFTAKAGWYENVWVADRTVCQYSGSTSGVVWVEGYWACNQYDDMAGQCTNWEWKAAHWEKTFTVY